MNGMEKIPDQSWKAVVEAARPDEVEAYLSDEFFKAIGLGADSLWQKWFGPLLSPIIRRFADQAAAFDQSVACQGFSEAARQRLERWTPGWIYEGRSGLPDEGPLLIAANHPGTFDGLAIVAGLPRLDLKIVAAANPFFRALPNTRRYFVYSTRDTLVRMATLRSALRHLQGGGALLIFPSGRLDPDPYYFPQAARRSFQCWSKSLELFLRKVPQARLVVAVNHGFVAPEYMDHPLVRLRRSDEARQKLAEFIQVIQQVVFNHPVSNVPTVKFSGPVTFPLHASATDGLLVHVAALAYSLIPVSPSGGVRDFPGDPSLVA